MKILGAWMMGTGCAAGLIAVITAAHASYSAAYGAGTRMAALALAIAGAALLLSGALLTAASTVARALGAGGRRPVE
ncbi:MAG: hypothetical protein ACYTG6_03480 [Planctomycetota bacterium]|jgi:hypothetical protein